jgi:hypothetical protein
MRFFTFCIYEVSATDAVFNRGKMTAGISGL